MQKFWKVQISSLAINFENFIALDLYSLNISGVAFLYCWNKIFLVFGKKICFVFTPSLTRVQWFRRRGCMGCKHTPKSFELLKTGHNPWKFGQNPWKSKQNLKISRKISENLGTKWRPTVFDFEKWRPKFAEKQMKTSLSWWNEKNSRQTLHDNFGKIWTKILRTLRNLLAPAPISMPLLPLRLLYLLAVVIGWMHTSDSSMM